MESKHKVQQLIRSQSLFTEAFKISPAAMGIASLDGRFIDVNDGLLAMVGCTREEAIGKTSAELGIWEDIEVRKAMIAELKRSGQVRDVEFRTSEIIGGGRELIGSFVQISMGEHDCVLGIIRDITEQKRTERRLKEAKDAADAANLAKSEFLANMSHEIRTPLGAISGYAEIVADPFQTEAERLRCISRLRYNVKHLSELIGDILDLSKVEAGKLSAERLSFPLLKELGEIFGLLKGQAETKGVRLHFLFASSLPEFITSDPARLRQILLNVVGNAVKFTHKGEVTVQVGADLKRKMLQMRIADDGCGIPYEAQDSLFQPFSQADSSTTRLYGGTGLGLALSRELARLLGGDVRLVQSAPGKGSVFEVEIELGEISGNLLKGPSEVDLHRMDQNRLVSRNHILDGIRVLLVEDNSDNQELVSHFLKISGAEVQLAENGQLAIDSAFSEEFDIVLMDMHMPVLDGYRATEQLRARGFSRPIIAVTARAVKEECKRCFDVGCDAYVTKPIEYDHLLGVVKKFVSVRP